MYYLYLLAQSIYWNIFTKLFQNRAVPKTVYLRIISVTQVQNTNKQFYGNLIKDFNLKYFNFPGSLISQSNREEKKRSNEQLSGGP